MSQARGNRAHRRGKGPERQEGEQDESRGVEGAGFDGNIVDGVKYNGRRGRKDGATSGARCDSKQVKTRPLAGYKKSQRQQYERMMGDVPRPSHPIPNQHRRLHTDPSPPRRRGQVNLKTNPRRVSRH
jgi:hypothetical protein